MKDRSVKRVYKRDSSIIFRKTHENFGGLSNMASGYPIELSGVYIRTSEALYQACRYPHLPDVQRAIISQNSPMTGKMKSKLYRNNTREDWENIRVQIMKWCLRVKLAQNWIKFGTLLESTLEYPIVEESHKDDFWGAKPIDENELVGINVLGRLLMELREEYLKFKNTHDYVLKAPSIDNFYLLGSKVETIYSKENEHEYNRNHKIEICFQMNTFHGKVGESKRVTSSPSSTSGSMS
ncbi:NADAR family protein [Clostridium algidicarnis]|uniref:NADAR family protein n=1 Tax=Clostridium algidicarnis TaxID=37659 RepID=UPI000A00B34B|nr:NADAR family protein [Clostridium algidicarnis]